MFFVTHYIESTDKTVSSKFDKYSDAKNCYNKLLVERNKSDILALIKREDGKYIPLVIDGKRAEILVAVPNKTNQ
jgi:hypothetical protein